ncbi:MAG: hypothetical protein BGO47_11855 [Microbacterium sp. 67-17]|jgi:ABC-type branched-subunit amino acid transport system permease subunit|uniref:ABC transporter permease subunit n=1 Tax=Microbacterium sp. 67-17 TaxID=1895782 RepID=UPI00095FC374|nr:hypothetical protein [Microbacterium sp. 67-17]OJW02401.1 MAG: hypothetical protein BGO47_11855 [Microbacterium sp. 67-17]
MEGKGIQLHGTGGRASNLLLDPAGSAAEGMMAATTVARAGSSLPDGAYRDATYACIALAALVRELLVAHNLVHSRFGRGIRALAGSESAAASSGVPVLRRKLTVFAVAGAMAGPAGAIGASFTPYVSQDSYPPLTSFAYVIMAVVGGLGSLWGGIVGAVAISVVLQALSALSAMPRLPLTAGPILQYAGYGLCSCCFCPRRRAQHRRGRVPEQRAQFAELLHSCRHKLVGGFAR